MVIRFIKYIYIQVQKLINAHYKFALTISIALIVLSGMGAVYSDSFVLIKALIFALAIASVLRITTYRIGKIPFLVLDKTWDTYSLKYSKEEAKRKYKEMSIKRASVYFLLALVTFLSWIVCELCFYLI